MAEAELARQADQDIEADAGNDQQRDLPDDERIIAIQRQSPGNAAEQDDRPEQRMGQAGGGKSDHTLRT